MDITDECWLWAGQVNAKGYGSIHYKERGTFHHRMAHRVVYENFVGPIPTGLQLDHLCRVKSCVNPSHLEPVTNWENSRRSREPL